MSRYYPQPVASWRYIAGLITGFLLGIGLALSASSNGQTVIAQLEAESRMPDTVICETTHFYSAGSCLPKPPSPAQRECYGNGKKALIASHVADGATTGVALAMGGTEIGLSGVLGPAMPLGMLAIKVIHTRSTNAQARRQWEAYNYDAACRTLGRNAIPGTFGATVNAVQIIGAM